MRVMGDERRLMVLRFVKRFREEHGYSPSLREICEGVGLRSPGNMHAVLEDMRERGLVVGGNLPRTLTLTEAGEELLAKEEERALLEKR